MKNIIPIFALLLAIAGPNEAFAMGGAAPSVTPVSSPSLSTANLTSKQSGPAVPAMNIDQVAALMESSHSQEFFNVQNKANVSLGVMDVVQTGNANYPYLSVSHQEIGSSNIFQLNLDYSKDLVSWIRLKTFPDSYSSQAAIRALNDGSYLLAYEYDPGNNGSHVRLRYYANLASLINPNDQPSMISDAAKASGESNDGTPSFRNIAYSGGGFNKMSIELTHHVHFNNSNGLFEGGRDEEGFSTFNWAQAGQWNVNNNCMFYCWPLNNLIDQQGVRGNIGGRDSFDLGGQRYFVVEAQTNPNDWGSWNLYLVQDVEGVMNPPIRKLQFQMPDRSAQSIGNPKISFVTLPNGHQAMIGTAFIFGQTPNGGTSNRAGEYMWVHEF